MEKKEKEKIIKETSENLKKEDAVSQNRELKRILIILGSVFAVFLLSFFIINSAKNFEYKGVEYTKMKEGKITFYNTAFPMYSSITGKHFADYNIYLRNDPRGLEKIPFEGEINLNVPTKKIITI